MTAMMYHEKSREYARSHASTNKTEICTGSDPVECDLMTLDTWFASVRWHSLVVHSGIVVLPVDVNLIRQRALTLNLYSAGIDFRRHNLT